jgi:hypothetical protein
MSQIRVARHPYHTMSPDIIATFARSVLDCEFIKYPSVFTGPPMTQNAFKGIIVNYENKRSAYVNGGIDQKGPYIEAYDELIKALDEFADSVDAIPNLTVAIILEGGFESIKEIRSKRHLPEAGECTVTLTHGGAAGVIEADCSIVQGAEYYHGLLCLAPLEETSIKNHKGVTLSKSDEVLYIDLAKQRSKTFEGLEPGTVYYVYYLIGNTKGISSLTSPARIMCV